jgi:hypothetical protein
MKPIPQVRIGVVSIKKGDDKAAKKEGKMFYFMLRNDFFKTNSHLIFLFSSPGMSLWVQEFNSTHRLHN